MIYLKKKKKWIKRVVICFSWNKSIIYGQCLQKKIKEREKINRKLEIKIND